MVKARHRTTTSTVRPPFLMYHAAIEAHGRLDAAGNLLLNRAQTSPPSCAPTKTRTPSPDPIACSETGECLTAPTGVFRVENGEFVLLDVILPEIRAIRCPKIRNESLGGG